MAIVSIANLRIKFANPKHHTLFWAKYQMKNPDVATFGGV